MNDLKNKISSLVIAVLTVILFLTVIVYARTLMNHTYRYEVSVKAMYNDLSRGSYEALVSDYRNNIRMGLTAEKNKEYTAIYAVAEYYIEAARARVFDEKGYAEEYELSKTVMENCRAKMGDISYVAEEIDTLFKLN